MKNYLRTLRIIHLTTAIATLVLLLVYSMTAVKGTIMLNFAADNLFQYMIPVLGVIIIPFAFFLFKKSVREIQAKQDNELKLQLYSRAFALRIIMIEFPAMFSVIAFALTLNKLYIAYTIISLAFYLPIYPILNKVKADLALSKDLDDSAETEQKQKSVLGKSAWLMIPLIAVIALMNYNYSKDLVSNKVVLPDVKVDSGTLTDSVYHNNYLNWTFIVPTGYRSIPSSEVDAEIEKGNKAIGNDTKKSPNTVRLLNITDGSIELLSELNPRVLYPKLTDEEKYLATADNLMNKAKIKNDNAKVDEQTQGIFSINSVNLKYVKYRITGKNGTIIMMFMVKFNKDYMFCINLSYKLQDSLAVNKLLDRLRTSELHWK